MIPPASARDHARFSALGSYGEVGAWPRCDGSRGAPRAGDPNIETVIQENGHRISLPCVYSGLDKTGGARLTRDASDQTGAATAAIVTSSSSSNNFNYRGSVSDGLQLSPCLIEAASTPACRAKAGATDISECCAVSVRYARHLSRVARRRSPPGLCFY